MVGKRVKVSETLLITKGPKKALHPHAGRTGVVREHQGIYTSMCEPRVIITLDTEPNKGHLIVVSLPFVEVA